METLKERKRSFNIDMLGADDADRLSKEIGAKMNEITAEAVEKANKILNVYGMNAKMQIAIEGINGAEKAPEEKPKKKRGRPAKAANLK